MLFSLILEREKRKGKQRETNIDRTNIDQLLSELPLTKDETHSLGLCPDQESKLWPFHAQDDAPATEHIGQG